MITVPIIEMLQNLLKESSSQPVYLLGKFQSKYPEESAILSMMKDVFFNTDSSETEKAETIKAITERLKDIK